MNKSEAKKLFPLIILGTFLIGGYALAVRLLVLKE